MRPPARSPASAAVTFSGVRPLVLPALDGAVDDARRPFLVVDVLGREQLLDQADLVVLVEDGEVRLEPDQLGVAAQHARGERVEGAEPQALGGAADQRRDPVLHLARRLVGEGDGEDLVRQRLAGHEQMGEPRGQHARLAGAGAGQHQDRAVQRLDRLALGRVEEVEIVHLRGRPRRGGGSGQARPRNGGRHVVGEVERIAHADDAYIAWRRAAPTPGVRTPVFG